MSETRELDTSLDQRQARELFNHLCQLASFDGGDGSQEDPRMLLKAAAEGSILDGNGYHMNSMCHLKIYMYMSLLLIKKTRC